MRITAVLLLCVLFALPLQAEVYHSSDFGWEADQDVSEEFAGLFKSGKLGKGDEFVLEHTYRVSGSYELPEDFTLSAVKGAGFEVTDVKQGNYHPFLVLNDGNTVRNLTINYLNTPHLDDPRSGITHGEDFIDKAGISASGKKNLRLENLHLEGSIAHHVRLNDRCEKPEFIGCHMVGGFWTVVLSAEDAVFRRCIFEKSHGDGIKTGWAKRPLVENCLFQDCGRDGIDTTGGWDESIVRDSIFRRLGVSGLDLKSHYNKKSDLDSPENVGILIENCTFLDMPNAVVFTTLDAGLKAQGEYFLNAENAEKYVPHDVDINNCTIGHVETPKVKEKKGGWGVNYPTQAGEYMRLLLVKDAHSIRYRNIRFQGERIMPVYFHSGGGTRYLSEEAASVVNYGVHGTIAGPAPTAKPGVKEAPFACGPQPLD